MTDPLTIVSPRNRFLIHFFLHFLQHFTDYYLLLLLIADIRKTLCTIIYKTTIHTSSVSLAIKHAVYIIAYGLHGVIHKMYIQGLDNTFGGRAKKYLCVYSSMPKTENSSSRTRRGKFRVVMFKLVAKHLLE